METERHIGQNKGRPRLWLEGAVLVSAGFKPQDHYIIEGRKLKKADEGRKVSGKGEKPIIDILGKAIEIMGFEYGDTVTVTTREGQISLDS